MPTLAWTTGLLVVSNVRYTALGVPSERLMMFDELNGWSKVMSKWTVYSCRWPSLTTSPQKWPLVSEPLSSRLFRTCAVLGQFAPSTAQVMNSREVSGSETSGHFCGEVVNDGQRQEYTVHFDITFDQPFSSSQIIPRSDGTPSAVYLTFDTTGNRVVQA